MCSVSDYIQPEFNYKLDLIDQPDFFNNINLIDLSIDNSVLGLKPILLVTETSISISNYFVELKLDDLD